MMTSEPDPRPNPTDRRLLIVADDNEWLMKLTLYFERLGYAVVTATQQDDLTYVAQTYRPHVMIAGVGQRAGIRATGGTRCASDQFVSAPFDLDDLRQRVERALLECQPV